MMALTRINNNISALNANRNLRATGRDLSISLERLSSGLRINRAADDAAGLTISENLRAQINGLNRAIENAADAISLVNTAEGALIESTNRLQRIRVLAVQAGNTGTNDAVALQALQDEIETSISEITRIADTTQFATRVLLNGDNANTATVAGGAAGGVTISPSPLSSTLSSGQHFLFIEEVTGGSETLSFGADAVDNSGATGFTGSTFDSGTYEITLTNVRAAASRTVSTAFAFTNAVTGADPIHTETVTDTAGNSVTLDTGDEFHFTFTNPDGTAGTYDFTLTAAPVSMDTLATNLEGAMTGVTVTYDDTTESFVITDTGTGETSLGVSFTIDDDDVAGAVNLSVAQEVSVVGNDHDGLVTIDGGPAVQVVAGQTGVVLSGPQPGDPLEPTPQITLDVGATLSNGTDLLTVVAQEYTGTFNGGQSVTFQNGDQNLRFRTGSSAGTPSGETALFDFDAAIDLGGATSRTFVVSAVNNSLNFQIGANAGQNVQVSLGNLRADQLGFSDETQPNGEARVVSAINITTLTGVNEALAIVDEALSVVSTQRSAMGAFTNRLEATISNLGVAAENLTASESRIRDADIAIETTRFTRNQILVQAGVSILSQANLLPQNVLQLLG